MTLAQVQFAVAIVTTLIGTYAALMMAVALTLPAHTEKARAALEASPKRCALNGTALLALFIMAIILLGNPLGRLFSFLILLALGVVVSVGAAGIAQLLGGRIGEMSGAKTSFGALVRGSLVYSFAMLFPYLGWFLFLPISTVCALGAGFIALRPKPQTVAPPARMETQGAA